MQYLIEVMKSSLYTLHLIACNLIACILHVISIERKNIPKCQVNIYPAMYLTI